MMAGPVVAALVGIFSPGVCAQSLDLKTTRPPRERVAPPLPDRDLYPQRPSLPDAPHFVGPLSRETETGRAGVAGFTASNPAVGSRVAGDHDTPGWPGVGFVVEWGRGTGRVD
jgi:hypothetical protein